MKTTDQAQDDLVSGRLRQAIEEIKRDLVRAMMYRQVLQRFDQASKLPMSSQLVGNGATRGKPLRTR